MASTKQETRPQSTDTPEAPPVASTETASETAPQIDALDHLAEPKPIDLADEHDPRIKAFVDHIESETIRLPRKWHGKELPSEKAVSDVTKLCRAYARATGRVFRVKQMPNARILAARVVKKTVKTDA